MLAFLYRTACFCVYSDCLMTVSRKFAGVFCDYYEFLQKILYFHRCILAKTTKFNKYFGILAQNVIICKN